VSKVLARLTGPILATVWRDLLVSADIPAEVTGDGRGPALFADRVYILGMP
jgi:hypothetical protein